MALIKTKFSEVPLDAIILTENDAFKYETEILQNWEKGNDVWAYRYGKFVLAAISGFVGGYLNSHYRLKVRLFSYGRIASYLSTITIPSVTCLFFHDQFVLRGVVLQNECPVCLQLRAAAFQTFAGVVAPSLLAPFASFSLALRYGTYDVPYVTKEPLKAFKFWQSKTRPIGNILFAIFLGQALAGALVTHLEARSVFNVNNELLKLDKSLNNT
ncbi:uncharacterized protein LOC108732745 [Agrilus planipennis]|uniref:Uncharacterized protein LOC108732745 n=1 Tax=Agrilus planipennis TaxID=224129 RepID=A0A1W4WFG0_AGRPL|nr:uncharacterized protein LOC108732745 [Agrilus planipennis]